MIDSSINYVHIELCLPTPEAARERAKARSLLDVACGNLSEACVGTVSEIFDAEPPYTPRGCVAQAWSVAEVLRCWAVVCGDCQP